MGAFHTASRTPQINLRRVGGKTTLEAEIKSSGEPLEILWKFSSGEDAKTFAEFV